jgi:peptidyl-prolyl cis-trans isomerase D
MLRGDTAAQELVELFKAPLPRQEAAVRTLYLSQNSQRTAKLYTLSASAIKAPAQPTDAQLDEVYKQNTASYTVPEYRTLSYLTITPKDAPKAQGLGEDEAQKAYDTFINTVEDAFAGGSTLMEVAKEYKLNITEIGTVDQQGKTQDGKAANIPNYNKFLEVAFKTDEGTESQLISIKDNGFYVVRVNKLIPERLRPLAEVKPAVTSLWQKHEAAKQLQTLATEIATAFSKPEARDGLIGKHGLNASDSGTLKRTSEYDTIPAPLLDDIFKTPVGKSTKAYPTNGGYTLAVVSSLIPANLPEAGSEKYYEVTHKMAEQLTKAHENELVDEYLLYLERKLSVDIDGDMLKAVKKE